MLCENLTSSEGKQVSVEHEAGGKSVRNHKGYSVHPRQPVNLRKQHVAGTAVDWKQADSVGTRAVRWGGLRLDHDIALCEKANGEIEHQATCNLK